MRSETITRYISDDGNTFYDEVSCRKHELLLAEVGAIMARLPSLPDNEDYKFGNGGGYIQHDVETFMSVRRQLLELANTIEPHKWFTDAIEKGLDVHASWPGRLISDMGGPLNKAWYRIMCVDKLFREWGQPYYAEHPNEGEQIRLN